MGWRSIVWTSTCFLERECLSFMTLLTSFSNSVCTYYKISYFYIISIINNKQFSRLNLSILSITSHNNELHKRQYLLSYELSFPRPPSLTGIDKHKYLISPTKLTYSPDEEPYLSSNDHFEDTDIPLNKCGHTLHLGTDGVRRTWTLLSNKGKFSNDWWVSYPLNA